MSTKIRFIIIITYFGLFQKLLSSIIDYSNESQWGQHCINGSLQSPINLPSRNDYNYTNSIIKIRKTEYEIIENLKFEVLYYYKYWINLTNLGFIEVNKNTTNYSYDLLFIQIHSPSEHLINGQKYDLELQIVHKKDNYWSNLNGLITDPDYSTQNLIISILYTAGDNYKDNPDISKFNINSNLPTNNNKSGLNLNNYVNSSNSFFYYSGSLTNPICHEPIDWIIMENIQFMSKNQLDDIKKWINILYPDGNSRKVKSLNDRQLYYKYPTSSYFTTLRIFQLVVICLFYLFI